MRTSSTSPSAYQLEKLWNSGLSGSETPRRRTPTSIPSNGTSARVWGR